MYSSIARQLVLDEADTLLDMGFRDDIEAIKDFLPRTPERQTFLFSATVSRSIQQIARSTLDKNHLFINTVSAETSPVHAHVKQFHTVLQNAGQQIPHIIRLLAHDQLSNPGKSKIILFFPTTKMTQLVATFLRELSKTVLPAGRDTRIYEIHSRRTQDARTNTSSAFRQDKSGASVLVTSDVSARGIDYPGVTRVIQVGIPASTEQYVHRVGRTGRAGTEGRGDLVLLPWEMGFVTYQLTEMPLKPLTVNELTLQVKELATKYDADSPGSFTTPDRNDRRDGTVRFQRPLTPVVDDLNRSITDLLTNLNEEGINETFASLLGYYIAKSQELRVQKQAIVQGCKDWAMEACGLPVPPYVSETFLQKLGVFESNNRSGGYPRKKSVDRWSGRGQQRLKGRNDGFGRSNEYQTTRYGQGPREDSDTDSHSVPSRKSYGFRRQADDGLGLGESAGYGNRGGREY